MDNRGSNSLEEGALIYGSACKGSYKGRMAEDSLELTEGAAGKSSSHHGGQRYQ